MLKSKRTFWPFAPMKHGTSTYVPSPFASTLFCQKVGDDMPRSGIPIKTTGRFVKTKSYAKNKRDVAKATNAPTPEPAPERTRTTFWSLFLQQVLVLVGETSAGISNILAEGQPKTINKTFLLSSGQAFLWLQAGSRLIRTFLLMA